VVSFFSLTQAQQIVADAQVPFWVGGRGRVAGAEELLQLLFRSGRG